MTMTYRSRNELPQFLNSSARQSSALIAFLLIVLILMKESLVGMSKPQLRGGDDVAVVDEKESSVNWKSSATLCERELEEDWFKSQSHEDEILLSWFQGLCGGTYVEMGGLDGMKLSNSYVFNKGLDWKGVLVELGPDLFKKLVVNRPNELATINAAVCDKKQKIHYVGHAQVGGIWEFMAPGFKEKWHSDKTMEDSIEMDCLPLNDILTDAVGDTFYFDFFSLDIEGAEYEALTSLDFTKFGFGILVVEADKHNQRKNLALRTLLESNGYTFLREEHRSYWFVNNDFGNIYKELLHA